MGGGRRERVVWGCEEDVGKGGQIDIGATCDLLHSYHSPTEDLPCPTPGTRQREQMRGPSSSVPRALAGGCWPEQYSAVGEREAEGGAAVRVGGVGLGERRDPVRRSTSCYCSCCPTRCSTVQPATHSCPCVQVPTFTANVSLGSSTVGRCVIALGGVVQSCWW